MIHNFTMDVDSGFKYTEKFRGGIQWYMMISKVFISNINFKLTNEKGDLVSFNRLSLTFRLSIKEVYFFWMIKTLIKSRYSPKYKIKWQTETPKVDSSLSLPTNLKSFEHEILSTSGFIT